MTWLSNIHISSTHEGYTFSHSVMYFVMMLGFLVRYVECTNENISVSSVFYYASSNAGSFESQVMQIDAQFCGPSECYNPEFALINHNPNCRLCTCDNYCVKFMDCCPYVSLFMGVPYLPREVPCLQPGRYPSKVGKRFYLITKCSEKTSDNIRYNCEENESTDAYIQFPVTGGGLDGVGYKNKYCALCNGATYIYPFTAYVTCRESASVMSDSDSNLEVFNAAMEATDCTVDFDHEASRICYESDEEDVVLIQTCNTTGMWEVYDSLVEMACHLDSYRIPVFGIYYNFFCYHCNTNKTWIDIQFDLIYIDYSQYQTDSSSKLQAVLLNTFQFNETQVNNQECFNIDDTSRCRNLICPRLSRFNPHYGGCEDIFSTNVLGYDICLTVTSSIADPSNAASEIHSEILRVMAEFELEKLTVNTLEASSLEVWICGDKPSYRQQVHIKLFLTKPLDRNFIAALLSMITRFYHIKPPYKCGQIIKLDEDEAACTVKTIPRTDLIMHPITEANILKDLASHVIYLPYSTLTGCCQMILEAKDYSVDKYNNMFVENSKAIVPDGNYIIHADDTATICMSDYVIYPYRSPCDHRADDFLNMIYNSPSKEVTGDVFNQYDTTTVFSNNNYIYQDKGDEEISSDQDMTSCGSILSLHSLSLRISLILILPLYV